MKIASRLKNNLDFNRDLDEIVNILKATASIQLRHFQSQQWRQSRFLGELDNSFIMCRAKDVLCHPLVNREHLHPKSIVVITSDEGFLGELNTLLVNAGLREKTHQEDELIVLGEKGHQYLKDIGQSYLFFPGISEKVEYQEAQQLKRYLMSEYSNGVFNSVVIVYADFVSVVAQDIKVQQFLPFPIHEIEESVRKAVKYDDILLEPSYDKIIETLISMRLSFMLYRIFYVSKLSEFSARLMHLEKSAQELTRRNRQLTLDYFKNMHSVADKRIREMLSARIVWEK